MDKSDLASLVDHRESVEADASMERVIRRFQEHGQHYMAVIDGVTYLGLLSDAQVGTMLGSRFGFSLHIRDSAWLHTLPEVLCADPEWSLLYLLQRVMERRGAQFYYDVPLVAKEGRFLGIISIQRLIREQARIMTDQMALAEQRRTELEVINGHLSESLEELRQSQGRYVSLFQQGPLGIVLLTKEGQVVACNQRLHNWLDTHVGDCDWTVREYLSAEELMPFLAVVPARNAKPSVPVVKGEVSILLPLRGKRCFRVQAAWIEESQQICATLQDITDQRALERGMALQDKVDLFERLAGGIAHELNNKLAPIIGFSELLSAELEQLPDAQKALRHCEVIRSSAEEAARMVRQLLQLSRPPQAEKAHCNLNEIAKDAWTIVEHRCRCNDIAAVLELCPKKVPVHVDGPQIKQVIVNLLINALDALEAASLKRLELSVGIEDSAAVLSVKDSGHGIPPETLKRIFDPFFTTKSPDRGTGLGLSVCLTVVQQHHGDIQVSSTFGKGTTFTVTLPLLEGQLKVLDSAKAMTRREGQAKDLVA
jgi:signal transduction histidine kinase